VHAFSKAFIVKFIFTHMHQSYIVNSSGSIESKKLFVRNDEL